MERLMTRAAVAAAMLAFAATAGATPILLTPTVSEPFIGAVADIPAGGFSGPGIQHTITWEIEIQGETGPAPLDYAAMLDFDVLKVGGSLGDQVAAHAATVGLSTITPHSVFTANIGAGLTADQLNALVGPGDTELDFRIEITGITYRALTTPEPSTLVMGLAALPAAWFWHRRRRAESA